MNIAFSQSCENNKQAILSILEKAFENNRHILEVGSGTGQHAIHFAEHLQHITWQTSDLLVNHPSINERINNYKYHNLARPLTVDLSVASTLEVKSVKQPYDGIFTANTLHIVSWHLVRNFFHFVGNLLTINGTLCVYGPFNYEGKFTSQSNERFDLWLKDRDTNSGIRAFEAIVLLAEEAGLTLQFDHTMPANNRLLIFVKK